MKYMLKYCLPLSMLLVMSASQSGFAQSMQEIQEYCQSMHSGMNDDESRAYIDECINEQKSYLDQDSYGSQDNYAGQENYESQDYSEAQSQQDYPAEYESYTEETYQEPAYEPESYTPESESQDQDCYSKVDEQIQKLLDNDPNSPFDYDQLLEQCLKGNH